MRTISRVVVLGILASACLAANALSGDDSVVVVFKDGHRHSFARAEIVRIDLSPAVIVYKDGHKEQVSPIDHIELGSVDTGRLPSRSHFVGKWEVGDGSGKNFYITLDPDGQAEKSTGASHGTWVLVDGEARVTWDDGWRDVIRKVGAKHEKCAYEPGRSLDDSPSNVTAARNTQAKPI